MLYAADVTIVIIFIVVMHVEIMACKTPAPVMSKDSRVVGHGPP